MLDTLLNYVRYGLYALLVALCFMLFQAWDKDHPKSAIPSVAAGEANTAPASDRFVPTTSTSAEGTAVAPAQPVAASEPAPAANPGQIVTVSTDLLSVKLDTRGGDIINADLLKYPQALGSSQPTVIFNDDPNTRYL